MESAGNGRPAGVSCGEGLDDGACDCCCWERKARCGRVHIKDERGRWGWGGCGFTRLGPLLGFSEERTGGYQ